MPKGAQPKFFEKSIDILDKVCYTIDSERRNENDLYR